MDWGYCSSAHKTTIRMSFLARCVSQMYTFSLQRRFRKNCAHVKLYGYAPYGLQKQHAVCALCKLRADGANFVAWTSLTVSSIIHMKCVSTDSCHLHANGELPSLVIVKREDQVHLCGTTLGLAHPGHIRFLMAVNGGYQTPLRSASVMVWLRYR